jgi:ribonuclease P protein subunit RPR2
MSKQVAVEEIEKLLKLARSEWSSDKKLSKRYVELALRIAKRNQVKIGNRRFCKKCLSIFIPGKNLKIRKSGENILYICECGNIKKFKVD